MHAGPTRFPCGREESDRVGVTTGRPLWGRLCWEGPRRENVRESTNADCVGGPGRVEEAVWGKTER